MTGPQQATHACPGPGCARQIPPDLLACRAHWYQVPTRIRSAVYAAWQGGAGAGSAAHTAAITAAIRYMRPAGAPR